MPNECVISKNRDALRKISKSTFNEDYIIIGGFNGYCVAVTKSSYNPSSIRRRVLNFYLVKIPTDWRKSNSLYERILSLDLDYVGSNKYSVSWLELNTEYRGRNIPTKFYHWLITVYKINLISDKEQSKGGSSVWKKLSAYSDIDIDILDDLDKYKLKSNKKKKLKSVIAENDNNTLLNSDTVFYARRIRKNASPIKK